MDFHYSRLQRLLHQLADRRSARSVSYAEAYNCAYDLCLRKRAAEVRALAEAQLRRLSLARAYDAYVDRAKEIFDIMLYEEHTHAFLSGLVPLTAEATWLYERPVARRWRRLRLHALWARRVAKWQAAFNHVRFMPGGSGTPDLMAEFYSLAG
jgi:hypothetical protein